MSDSVPVRHIYYHTVTRNTPPFMVGEFLGHLVSHRKSDLLMICDGRVLRKAEYPELYAVFGDAYLGDRLLCNELFATPDLIPRKPRSSECRKPLTRRKGLLASLWRWLKGRV